MDKSIKKLNINSQQSVDGGNSAWGSNAPDPAVCGLLRVNGGATIWARQTINSDIFRHKPDKWFKIWFYIINKVNHQDNKFFKRGSNFITYEEITQFTGATKYQIKGFFRNSRDTHMLTTQKTTRGMIINVVKYGYFQDFNNYKATRKTTSKPHRSHTINNNGNNDNNIYTLPAKAGALKDNKKPMKTINIETGEYEKLEKPHKRQDIIKLATLFDKMASNYTGKPIITPRSYFIVLNAVNKHRMKIGGIEIMFKDWFKDSKIRDENKVKLSWCLGPDNINAWKTKN